MAEFPKHPRSPSLADLPVVCDEMGDRVDLLEGYLLRLDHAIRCSVDTSEVIHMLLRHAHSVKGSLGLARLTRMLPLLHAFESIFVALRDHRMVLEHAVVDEGFAVVDLMREACARNSDAGLDLDPTLARIEALLGRVSTADVGTPLTFTLSSGETTLARQALSAGNTLYLAHKVIETSIPSGVFAGLPIWETLRSIACLIAHRPLFSDLPRRRPECMLSILFATDLPRTEVSRQVFDAFHKVAWEDPLGSKG